MAEWNGNRLDYKDSQYQDPLRAAELLYKARRKITQEKEDAECRLLLDTPILNQKVQKVFSCDFNTYSGE